MFTPESMLTPEDLEGPRRYVERKSEVDPHPETQERCRRLRELIIQAPQGNNGELPSDSDIDHHLKIARGLREVQA
jgi:hypothetical protein